MQMVGPTGEADAVHEYSCEAGPEGEVDPNEAARKAQLNSTDYTDQNNIVASGDPSIGINTVKSVKSKKNRSERSSS